MRHRAERLGGGMEIGTSREGGTRLTWHVPLLPSDEPPAAGPRTARRSPRDDESLAPASSTARPIRS